MCRHTLLSRVGEMVTLNLPQVRCNIFKSIYMAIYNRSSRFININIYILSSIACYPHVQRTLTNPPYLVNVFPLVMFGNLMTFPYAIWTNPTSSSFYFESNGVSFRKVQSTSFRQAWIFAFIGWVGVESYCGFYPLPIEMFPSSLGICNW